MRMNSITKQSTMSAPDSESGAWPELHRVRRAIVVVDVVESVRLMQAYEADVIDRWRRFVGEVRTQALPLHGGRMVKHLGDGMLLEFEHVSQAIAAAFDINRRLPASNAGRPADAAIHLRMGVHVADVVVDELDLFGAGVNLTARLAGLAAAGEIVVSPEVNEQLIHGLDADSEDLGECWVKHVDAPLRAYRVLSVGAPGANALRHAPSAPIKPTLAVMDLAATGPAQLLGSLLADEVSALLAVHGTVDVISRLSTRQRTRSTEQGALDLLRHLRTAYGLAGSCTESAGQLVLRFELLFVATNTVVWSGSTRSSVRDAVSSPAAVLEPICSQAMGAIRAHETRRARTMPIASLQSYALLLGGVALMHRLSVSDFERARTLLEAVIERVPRHPDAFAWMAKWHILAAHQGWSSDTAATMSRAAESARRALDLDDGCALALTISGMVQIYFHRRLDEGEALYRRAIEAFPNDSLAWLLKGTLHGFRGEGQLALHDTRRALALSPLDPLRYYYLALAASAAASAGEHQEAIDLATSSLRANSMHASTLRVLAIAYSMLGRMDEAQAVVSQLMTLDPAFTVGRFLERAPGADFEIGKTFAGALLRAGVPH